MFCCIFFEFFSSVKSVCLSRCFIFGLGPSASCEAFFVAFLCLLLPSEIIGTSLCEFSMYYDWFIEFIKTGRKNIVKLILILFITRFCQPFPRGWILAILSYPFRDSFAEVHKLHKYASVNANVDLHNIMILFFHVLISAAIINPIGI